MTEYLDRYPTMHEYAEGKRINPKLTDLISRADAIKAVRKIVPYVIDKDTGQWGILVNKANVITELSALPSADAVPIVYCMDCTTLRHSYCNNGERKGGDDE